MSYKIQASFSAGELDPSLHERTTLDKYKTGLATGRNVIIGKTGRIISRFGSEFALLPKYADKKHVTYAPPFSSYILEWGHEYYRIHNLEDGTYYEGSHSYTEDHLNEHIHFTSSKTGIYVFLKKATITSPFTENNYEKFFLIGSIPGSEFDTQVGTVFEDTNPLAIYGGTGNGAGHAVDYMFTLVINGLETSAFSAPNTTTGYLMITSVAQSNLFQLRFTKAGTPSWQNVSELRAYRRPKDGGAYGYIGSTGAFVTTDATYVTIGFTDIGAGADYTVSPPNYYTDFALNQGPAYSLSSFPQWSFTGFAARTGIMYGQRLVVVDDFQNAIAASRIGTPRSFTRDYPLNDACGLLFKTAGEGNARILRLLDAGALAAFTTEGLFANDPGPLVPTNSVLSKKGDWVIDEKLPPLSVPGAFLIFDILSNSVVALNYSYENSSFNGEEVSIFSNHLIAENRIVSWAFLDGQLPVVLAVRDDGIMLCFSYQKEHQMKAWTWFDTDGEFENVVVRKNTDGTSTAYVSVKRGDVRTIEKFKPRFVDDLKEFVGTDSSKTFNTQFNEDATITVTPVTPGDWEGSLVITSDTSIFVNTAGNGAVDSVFKFFDSEGSGIELTVTAYTSGLIVTATPSSEFPEDEAEDINLYKTFSGVLSGLSHLNGKQVTVIVDGYLVSSPNNTVESYPAIAVSAGNLVLPANVRGAFIHIGLPVTSDVETLDIDTVEQKPTLLEEMIVNLMYLKVFNTRGLFAGSEFPADNFVTGMEDLEERTEDIVNGNIGNAAQAPQTKRYEKAIPNDWDSKGRICLRQVDPYPFEILSIIPDLQVFR